MPAGSFSADVTAIRERTRQKMAAAHMPQSYHEYL
jgi:hypothetical protein